MDGDICDKIIEDFEYRENNSFFDKVRGYHRLQNGQMDSDLMDEYMTKVREAFNAYKKEYKSITWIHTCRNTCFDYYSSPCYCRTDDYCLFIKKYY